MWHRVSRRSRFAQRNTPIARKAAVAGVERGDAADLPFSRNRPSCPDLKQRIAERRPHRERAHDLVIDAVTVALDRFCDGTADQCTARCTFDPGNLSAWTAFPTKQSRSLDRVTARHRCDTGRPHLLPPLDPLDNVM